MLQRVLKQSFVINNAVCHDYYIFDKIAEKRQFSTSCYSLLNLYWSSPGSLFPWLVLSDWRRWGYPCAILDFEPATISLLSRSSRLLPSLSFTTKAIKQNLLKLSEMWQLQNPNFLKLNYYCDNERGLNIIEWPHVRGYKCYNQSRQSYRVHFESSTKSRHFN